MKKRISITPDIIVNKYIKAGFTVQLPKNYGSHLGFSDSLYATAGVKIFEFKWEVLKNSNIIIQLDLPAENYFTEISKNSILVGSFSSLQNKEKVEKLKSNGVNVFSLELLPRITEAQSMDILSSQANLAGYKAVIEAFAFEKAIPMMMTAAGTVPAAKVLIVGAGVAGLQAVATAKRMGAIVFATDVRMASKEQVESLGGEVPNC